MNTYINGNRVSFLEANMSADGFDVPGSTMMSLNWQSQKEPGIIQGNGVRKAGNTRGYYTATADFEILVNEAKDFEQNLVNNSGGVLGVLDIFFDIQADYSLPDESEIHTISLRGCQIKTRGVSPSGTDALRMKYELIVSDIEFNGISDVT